MLCAVLVVLGAWFAMIGGSFLFVGVCVISAVNPCHLVKITCGFSCNAMVGMPYSPCFALPALLPDELPTFAPFRARCNIMVGMHCLPLLATTYAKGGWVRWLGILE